MLPFSKPRNEADLQALYFKSVQAHNQGDFKTARQGYETVLSVAPNQVDTNFQLGRLLVQIKSAKDGLKYLEKAANLAPATFEFWRLFVETLAGTGMKKQAKRAIKRAAGQGFSLAEMSMLADLAERDPAASLTPLGDAPKDQVDRAVFLFQSGDIDGAEQLARRLVRDHAEVAFVHNLLGVILMHKQAFQDAGESFALASELDPFFPDAFSNLGRAYLAIDAFDEALPPLKTAIELAPDLVAAHINIGSAYLGVKQFPDAKRHFERALKAEPNSTDCLIGLAQADLGAGHFAAALKSFERAQQHQTPEQQETVVCGIAECWGELGRSDDKISALQEFLTHASAASTAQVTLGVELSKRGEFDAAKRAFLAALDVDPKSAQAYQGLSAIKVWRADDPLIAQGERLYLSGSLDEADQVLLAFALAKMMEDTKQSDKVFQYLDFANAALRKDFTYSTQKVRAEFDAMVTNYAADFFNELAEISLNDETPVFIVGMPRSGTTLTERIISNHPKVAGGGELGSASNAFMMALTDENSVLLGADKIDRTALGDAARTCLTTLKTRFPDSLFVTDKLPHTFVVVGFLLALLPKAHIVHVRRNPVDNCFSIYKNQFLERHHRYSNDLAELGAYYGMYSKLMDHWETLFPGQIVQLDYDALVSDPERKARELIASLGLEWDEACLETRSQNKTIKTLSIYQARQPIYKSSSRGWHKYESDLRVLTDALHAEGVAFD